MKLCDLEQFEAPLSMLPQRPHSEVQRYTNSQNARMNLHAACTTTAHSFPYIEWKPPEDIFLPSTWICDDCVLVRTITPFPS